MHYSFENCIYKKKKIKEKIGRNEKNVETKKDLCG